MRKNLMFVFIILIILAMAACANVPGETETLVDVEATPKVTYESTPAATPNPTPESTETPTNGFKKYSPDIELNGYANRGFSIADGSVVYIPHPYVSDICGIDVQTGEVSYIKLTSNLTMDVIPLELICIHDEYIVFLADGRDFNTNRDLRGEIMRIGLDGGTEETLYTPEDYYMQMSGVAYNQFILYNFSVDGRFFVFRIDMDTGESMEMKALSTRAVASDGENIYVDLFIDDNGPGLWRASMDGNNIEVVASGVAPEFIVPTEEWIYFSSYTTYPEKLWRVKKNGSELQELGIVDGFSQFNVAGDYIYYVDPNDGSCLYRMKTDGTNKEKLCDIESVSRISISAGRVFFDYKVENGFSYASIMPDGSGLIELAYILEELPEPKNSE